MFCRKLFRFAPSAALAAATVLTGLAAPLTTVPNGDLTLLIEQFSAVPQSSNSSPRARINHLKPVGDGSGRLFVNDLNGRMYLVAKNTATLYLDLEAQIPAFKDAPGLGTGFASIAFHPQFATNGKLYTAHSDSSGAGTPDFVAPVAGSPTALQGVVMEWTATNPAANVFAGTKREIMRVNLVGTIHGMQEISFNPNASTGDPDFGKLYICIGDSGSTIGGRPLNTARLDSVLGTILRIDPLGNNSTNGKYGVPADNPWASDGNPNTFGEIWVYGFRNPHRISWDTGGDGKMLSGDIGERNIEEVNLILPGRHYGWNEREGTFRINPEFANNPGAGTNDQVFPLPADDASRGFTYPVAQYDHDEGVAIVGGYVYRGPTATHLTGKYIFGEIVDGQVYYADAAALVLGSQAPIKKLHLKLDGVAKSFQAIVGNSRTDLRFGYDDANELYLLEKINGKIYKVVGSEGPVVEPSVTGGAGTRLVNISTRGEVLTGARVLIGGFVISGDQPRRVLIRAAGPALGALGVPGTLADPVLTLFPANGTVPIGENIKWGDNLNAAEIVTKTEAVGAFSFGSGSNDAVLLVTLAPGSYTAQVSGNNGTTGIALVEVYDVP